MATIICFEGIDGSGKTTQAALLEGYLNSLGKTVVARSYPVYGSFFGREIGAILSGRGVAAAAVDPKSMALWYALDRWKDYAEHRARIVDADFVILNRYTLSSAIYQAIRSSDAEHGSAWVGQLEHEILGLPRPTLYVVLDVPASTARDNVSLKPTRDYVDTADIYERDEDLQARARSAYQEFAATSCQAALVECAADGSLLPAEIIHGRVVTALRTRGLLP